MKWFRFAAAALLFTALSSCGGGGGGGGGFPILPMPLTTTVLVNGNPATAGSNGQFAIKPGDVIAVTPSQSADWTSNAVPSGSITLRNPDVSANRWSAQIVNTTNASAVFTVSAKATANGALAKDTVFAVSAGDARNASYKVFTTNGSRQTLALNFDTMTYVMTDAAGVATSDTFVVDPAEAGSYLFNSTRNTAKALNARFRLTTDTVVGSFPFEVVKLQGAYAVQPFVASRALATSQAALDGVYTRLGVNLEGLLLESEIGQFQVTGGGTVAYLCNDATITSVAACPQPSLLTYAVTAGAAPDSWNLTNIANPGDATAFSVARIGGKNVYLSSGALSGVPNNARLQIGLEESSAWPATTASGGDTNGSWGTVAFDATTYTSVLTQSDGTAAGFTASLSQPTGTFDNLRSFSGNGNSYFAAQDGTLSVVVGARAGAVAGYMQIGLVH